MSGRRTVCAHFGSMALSNTTLVNVDADTAQNLAVFIGSKLPSLSEEYVSECKALIDSSNTQALVAKFMEKHNLLLELESDDGKSLYYA